MSITPWDLKAPSLDSELWELWKKFKPHDFYFGVSDNSPAETVVVFIVPADYYEKFGIMLDDSMPIGHLLPNNLTEIMAAIYESDRMIETTRYDLLERGFVNDERFQRFIDTSEWFSED